VKGNFQARFCRAAAPLRESTDLLGTIWSRELQEDVGHFALQLFSKYLVFYAAGIIEDNDYFWLNIF
jgi:hypothetical protein